MTIIPWVIPIRLVDLLEIGLVAYLLYKLYLLMRGTIAVQIFFGILALYLIQVLVTAANMTILRALFNSISDVFVLALIILFQPEIRRVLLLLGQNPLIRRFVRSPAQEAMIGEVVAAVAEMSKRRIGALIAFERTTGLRNYIETGAELQAKVTKDLLITLFFNQNPLHDGAVIIRSQRIEAARCILPVSTSMSLSPHLGLRHRAAVGLTEQTDAFVVVVSEETGHISVARNGELIQNITVNELRSYLTEALSPQSAAETEPAEV
ncbi:diadenylate cyclase CdaA [Rhodocaloribacter litoris]|uniref:diadenylate cyclase CdaA n=1 Tax=Rhodocaloribacter litoris TaxID=2558931 RepID=UPI00142038C5|nr:diadenylate cyclase CdaA [Rhodocaloribacter litoris]QXD16507.1 diadenylate cyclase CdaA [Rhodocaloribacter litoris]